MTLKEYNTKCWGIDLSEGLCTPPSVIMEAADVGKGQLYYYFKSKKLVWRSFKILQQVWRALKIFWSEQVWWLKFSDMIDRFVNSWKVRRSLWLPSVSKSDCGCPQKMRGTNLSMIYDPVDRKLASSADRWLVRRAGAVAGKSSHFQSRQHCHSQRSQPRHPSFIRK